MTTDALSDAFERRIAEFYSPEQPRAKDGEWTRGGASRLAPTNKVWSGISADPVNRKVPKPQLTQFEEDTHEETVHRMFSADLGKGYSSRVRTTDFTSEGIDVTGSISYHENQVGEWRRVIQILPDKIVVHHEILKIDPEYQGMGLGDRFNAHAIREYQSLGVDSIKLEAAMEVGGYAWARQGFRLDPEHTSNNAAMKAVFGKAGVQTLKPVVRDYGKEIKDEIAAVKDAMSRGEAQPIHIAAIGEQHKWETRDIEGRPYTTWVGKEALLDSIWHGVYYFDAAKHLTAGATDIEHAVLRPEASGRLIAAFNARMEFYNPNHDQVGRFASRGGGGSLSTFPARKNEHLPLPPDTAARIDAMTKWKRLSNVSLREENKTIDAKPLDVDLSHGQSMIKHDAMLRIINKLSPEQIKVIRNELADAGFDGEPATHLDTAFDPVHVIPRSMDTAMRRGYEVSARTSMQYAQAIFEIHQNDIGEKNPGGLDGHMVQGSTIDSNMNKLKEAMWGKTDQEKSDNLTALGYTPEKGFVSALQAAWADSSNLSPLSYASQGMAAKIGKIDLNSAQFEYSAEGERNGDAAYKAYSKSLEYVMEATHQVTQDYLTEHGIESLTLFRGIAGITDERLATGNMLSSWSTDLKVAQGFSQMYDATGPEVTLASQVPAQRIYSLSSVTGIGCYTEAEVVVFGGSTPLPITRVDRHEVEIDEATGKIKVVTE